MNHLKTCVHCLRSMHRRRDKDAKFEYRLANRRHRHQAKAALRMGEEPLRVMSTGYLT